MNEHEWLEWERNALQALSCRYGLHDALLVVNWFGSVKTSRELDLIGPEKLDALMKVMEGVSIYDSMMARAFIYAPLILKKVHPAHA